MSPDVEDGPAELARRLRRAYLGEVGGATFFRTLREHLEDESLRAKAYALELLEMQTAQQVADVLRAMNLELGDETTVIERSAVEGEEAARLPWSGMIDATLEIEPEAIVAYRKLTPLLTDATIAEVLVQHAEALIEFAERERAGDVARSLEPIVAVLSTESRRKLAAV